MGYKLARYLSGRLSVISWPFLFCPCRAGFNLLRPCSLVIPPVCHSIGPVNKILSKYTPQLLVLFFTRIKNSTLKNIYIAMLIYILSIFLFNCPFPLYSSRSKKEKDKLNKYRKAAVVSCLV